MISDLNQRLVSKFNIDKELEIPKGDEMNLSILSSLNNSQEEYEVDSNEISASNLSFTSGSFVNVESGESNSKAPKIPLLNLSKINQGHKNSGVNFSLNLSAISGNQSIHDTTCPSDKDNLHNYFDHKRSDSNTMINELFGTQTHHNRRVSNLDLTFEKSDSKDEESNNWFKESVQSSQKKKKSGFKGAHWNFGSKRSKNYKQKSQLY